MGRLIVRPSELHGVAIPPELVPLAIDEFPMVFVAAALARGETIVSGAAELRHKESDRISVMVAGLRALGIEVEELPDGARIQGGRFSGGTIDSRGDHRVAMAFAVGAARAPGPVRILDTANVATSFPGFRARRLRRLAWLSRRVRMAEPQASPVPVVAIDGPGGAGKGTISRLLAERLGWHLLDSGALYRLVALDATNGAVALDAEAEVARIAASLDVRFDAAGGEERVWLRGRDVTQAIRTEACGQGASVVAALPAVRAALVQRQRDFRQLPGLVADGRDMGTVIFPDAGLKVFLTASVEERARRRHKQLKDKGIDVSLAALSGDMAERDRRDSERSVAPLSPGQDARILDTTGMSIPEVVDLMSRWASESYPGALLRRG